MAEYIERETLLKSKDWLSLQDFDRARAKVIILGQPTADVVEVRHAHWKDALEELVWQDVCVAECSACGESWVLDGDFDFDACKEYWHYCPNCGAKMDGKGEG